MVESVAETDEALMEKYFSDGELAMDELVGSLREAILNLIFFRAFLGDAYNSLGGDRLQMLWCSTGRRRQRQWD